MLFLMLNQQCQSTEGSEFAWRMTVKMMSVGVCLYVCACAAVVNISVVAVVVQGYRTGYVYREPLVSEADEGKQPLHSEVIVPPTVSSYTYSFDEDTGREATYVVASSRCFPQCCPRCLIFTEIFKLTDS